MKKIVALVLSLVMVLGLATTAFGAITLWAPNGSTAECDIYDGEYNTKLNPTDVPVDVKFVPAKALKLDKDGNLVNAGNIAYYVMSADVNVPMADWNDAQVALREALGGDMYTSISISNGYVTGTVTSNYYFVKVASIPADKDAADYRFVKTHDDEVEMGYIDQFSQTAKDPYTILKAVDGVFYYGEAVAFTEWSDDCEKYEDPEVETALGTAWPYYTVTKMAYPEAFAAGFVAKIPAAVATVVDDEMNVLVGGEVVTLDANKADWVFATAHAWQASAWNEKTGAVTEYTCLNCKTVGTVINASINAPAGSKIDKLADGTLIAYNMAVVEAPAVDAGDKVESAQTFDAGIAMYVGMSVMAAAGSAVVLKKKD